MNTIRELIIQEFITRGATIVSTGSPRLYSTNIGSTVLRSRAKVDPDELPCLIIHAQDEEINNIHGYAKHQMTMKIEGLVKFGSSSPSVISEQILGDIIKCFTAQTWDRRRIAASPASPVTYLRPYADSIVCTAAGPGDAPEDGALTAGAWTILKVTYMTVMGNPYATE